MDPILEQMARSLVESGAYRVIPSARTGTQSVVAAATKADRLYAASLVTAEATVEIAPPQRRLVFLGRTASGVDYLDGEG
jgi:hypothetical protein